MQWYLKVLREYANFEGRARRTEYWMFVLFYAIFYIACLAVDFAVMAVTQFPVPVLTVAYLLAMLVPTIAVVVRRLHDTDRSGWWYFISLIPLAGPIVLIVFLATEGTPWPNRYGPNPKADAAYYQPQYSGPSYQGPTYA